MIYKDNKVENIKIAYIGGGSRGWAWGLMSDLASADDISGEVALYDIDLKAAQDNVIIGNKFKSAEGAKSEWNYYATETLEEALNGANFVVISILPGTFDEMESDVHAPEKYGIYQPVGDSTGPGGIIRALRTIPMMQVIAEGVKKCCPEAWVINYTNPMTVSIKALYETFPEIRAFGCCHEVFGTQHLLATALGELRGIGVADRREIKTEVIGVNHFTWITKAKYRDIDLFPVYRELVEKYGDTGYFEGRDENWVNNVHRTTQQVKFDLFRRYGLIAAAGDRHLAEFCPGKWYLESPETVDRWGFGLTSVKWRKEGLDERLERSRRRLSGEEKIVLSPTGEEGVAQIRALLGLEDLVTNVNIPNVGQISNLPMGAVVETNAVFRDSSLVPVMSGAVPTVLKGLIDRIVCCQELVTEAAVKRDLELAYIAFINDPLVTINHEKARELFNTMVDNTAKYLSMYKR